MAKPQLLFDACTHPGLMAAVRNMEPAIDALRVGDPGTPPTNTFDPDLLIAAAALGRLLISNDRHTMPGHLIDHFAAGRHTAGVVLLRGNYSLGRCAREIVQQWIATEADDWIDRTIYLP